MFSLSGKTSLLFHWVMIMNKMREIRVEKVVLNMGCGTTYSLENAKKILELVSGRKTVLIKTWKRSTFNFPKGKEIGCKVTIRNGSKKLLKKLLEAKENLEESNFDSTGNLSFGVKEYIDVPDMEYDPNIPVTGFDVCVTLERPGYSVKKRKVSGKVGKKHLIKKEEAIEFMKNEFGVKVR